MKSKTDKLREEYIKRIYATKHFDEIVDVVDEYILKAKTQWKQEALENMPEEKDITELVKRSDLHKKYKDQLSYDLGDNQGYNQAIQECKKAIRES